MALVIPRGKILFDGCYIGNSRKRFEWRNQNLGRSEEGVTKYDRGLYLIITADDMNVERLSHIADKTFSVSVQYIDAIVMDCGFNFTCDGVFIKKVVNFSGDEFLNITYEILVQNDTLKFTKSIQHSVD